MAQAEVVEAGQRRRDRVERTRPAALRRVAPEDVLGGDVEEHGALSPAAASRASRRGGRGCRAAPSRGRASARTRRPFPRRRARRAGAPRSPPGRSRSPPFDARETQTQASTGPSGVSVVRVSRRRSPAASRFSRALSHQPALGVRDLEGQPPALAPGSEAEDGAGRLGRSPAPPGLVQEGAPVPREPGRASAIPPQDRVPHETPVGKDPGHSPPPRDSDVLRHSSAS